MDKTNCLSGCKRKHSGSSGSGAASSDSLVKVHVFVLNDARAEIHKDIFEGDVDNATETYQMLMRIIWCRRRRIRDNLIPKVVVMMLAYKKEYDKLLVDEMIDGKHLESDQLLWPGISGKVRIITREAEYIVKESKKSVWLNVDFKHYNDLEYIMRIFNQLSAFEAKMIGMNFDRPVLRSTKDFRLSRFSGDRSKKYHTCRRLLQRLGVQLDKVTESVTRVVRVIMKDWESVSILAGDVDTQETFEMLLRILWWRTWEIREEMIPKYVAGMMDLSEELRELMVKTEKENDMHIFGEYELIWPGIGAEILFDFLPIRPAGADWSTVRDIRLEERENNCYWDVFGKDYELGDLKSDLERLRGYFISDIKDRAEKACTTTNQTKGIDLTRPLYRESSRFKPNEGLCRSILGRLSGGMKCEM